MGGDKKDDKSKEEAVRIHWSTDPVHANLHSYYKLASNLLDYHKNFKALSQEASAGPKRARSSSSNSDGAEDAASGMNPAKKKREDHKGKASGTGGATGTPDTGRRPAPPPPIRTEDTLPSEPVRGQIQPQLQSPWRLRRLRGSPRRTRQQEPRPRTARQAALLLDRATTGRLELHEKKPRKSTLKIFKNFITVIFVVSYNNII